MPHSTRHLAPFQGDADFLACRTIEFPDAIIRPGDPFPKNRVSLRRLRQFYEQRKIRYAVEPQRVRGWRSMRRDAPLPVAVPRANGADHAAPAPVIAVDLAAPAADTTVVVAKPKRVRGPRKSRRKADQPTAKTHGPKPPEEVAKAAAPKRKRARRVPKVLSLSETVEAPAPRRRRAGE